jgi:hypothetical protein
MLKPAIDYNKNLFTNCPFDDDYQPIFNVLVFTTYACGLRPRCAKEVDDASDVRIEKILPAYRGSPGWGLALRCAIASRNI